MTQNLHVKFCGLRSTQDIAAAAAAGARYVGFVFFEKSPRHVTIDQAAELAIEAPMGLCKVCLLYTSDAADE